jgi:hypothetical protein
VEAEALVRGIYAIAERARHSSGSSSTGASTLGHTCRHPWRRALLRDGAGHRSSAVDKKGAPANLLPAPEVLWAIDLGDRSRPTAE